MLLHLHHLFITFATDFATGESLMQNFRVHAKNQFLKNVGVGSEVMAVITLKKGGLVKKLKMSIPADVFFHHGFLLHAEKSLWDSKTAFEKSQSSYKPPSKAEKNKAKESAKLSLEAARKAAMFNRSSLRAYAIMANSLLTLGRHREALAPLGMAIALCTSKEHKARLLFVRGSTYKFLGKYPLAIADFEKLLLMPGCKLDKSVVMVHLGGCYARFGNLEKGTSLLKEAFSMKLADRFSESASNVVYDFMFVVASVAKAKGDGEANELVGLWAKWRKL